MYGMLSSLWTQNLILGTAGGLVLWLLFGEVLFALRGRRESL